MSKVLSKLTITQLQLTPYYKELITLEKQLFNTTLEQIYNFDTELLFIIIIEDEKLIGFLIYKDRDVAFDIFKVGINPTYQRQQLASLLVTEIKTKDIVLEVRVTNTSAVNLYKKLNFKQFATLPGYYQGEDGIKMIWRYNDKSKSICKNKFSSKHIRKTPR